MKKYICLLLAIGCMSAGLFADENNAPTPQITTPIAQPGENTSVPVPPPGQPTAASVVADNNAPVVAAVTAPVVTSKPKDYVLCRLLIKGKDLFLRATETNQVILEQDKKKATRFALRQVTSNPPVVGVTQLKITHNKRYLSYNVATATFELIRKTTDDDIWFNVVTPELQNDLTNKKAQDIVLVKVLK